MWTGSDGWTHKQLYTLVNIYSIIYASFKRLRTLICENMIKIRSKFRTTYFTTACEFYRTISRYSITLMFTTYVNLKSIIGRINEIWGMGYWKKRNVFWQLLEFYKSVSGGDNIIWYTKRHWCSFESKRMFWNFNFLYHFRWQPKVITLPHLQT